MRLFVLVLNEEAILDDVLTLFVEVGVGGATVIESVGMGQILAEEIPLFAGFQDLLRNHHPHNRTILSVVPAGLVETLSRELERVFRIPSGGRGIHFSLALEHASGVE